MTLKRILTALALALALAACTPRTATPAAPAAPAPEESEREEPERERRVLTDPAALEADRAAREAFHLMGLAYLETGSYSAEVLLRELNLPPGVLWAIQEISETSYTLQLTSDSVPGVAWTVTPEGVVARAVADNRIY
jgi:hypothetical protein